MKNVFFCFVLLLLGLQVQAQDQTTIAQADADKLIELYQLDDQQQVTMLEIQERKQRNLAEIEPLRATDVKRFQHKLRAIHYSTDASIRRLLKEEQMDTYRQARIEWRTRRAAKVKELKEAGASAEEIEAALLELEN